MILHQKTAHKFKRIQKPNSSQNIQTPRVPASNSSSVVNVSPAEAEKFIQNLEKSSEFKNILDTEPDITFSNEFEVFEIVVENDTESNEIDLSKIKIEVIDPLSIPDYVFESIASCSQNSESIPDSNLDIYSNPIPSTSFDPALIPTPIPIPKKEIESDSESEVETEDICDKCKISPIVLHTLYGCDFEYISDENN